MSSPSSRISFHNDPFSRAVMRALFLLQMGAMVLVVWLCLSDRFVLARLISFFTLLVFLAVLVWLYARYQTLPVVCEKRILSRLVLKFEKNVQVEEFREQAAVTERGRLVRAERQEIRAALSALQKNYIKTGLGNTTIRHAAITGVGPKLKEQLAGYGILTAAHVTDRIAQLPGFGVEKCHALMSWRGSVVAKLESTKPSALPPGQLDLIQQKYEELQDKNKTIERKAIANQQILEHELMSLKPRLRGLASITFPGYFRRSLASRGIVAALVAFALVMTQVISSVSATLAFGASSAAALIASIPTATGTPAVKAPPPQTSTPANTSTPTAALTSMITDTPPMSSTPTPTDTPPVTFTPLPPFTRQPENTLSIAAPPVNSGGNTGNCDPSYPGVCIPPAPPDLDCKDVPYDNFTVLPPDPHNFDREGDGLGCEG